MRRFSWWYVASWNVRTLLDVEGSIATARRRCDVSVVDERKIDQVVSELVKYRVVVAGLQETKWFGNEVYKVGECGFVSWERCAKGRGEWSER